MEIKPQFLLVFTILHNFLCAQTLLVSIFADSAKDGYEERNAAIQIICCMVLMTINNIVWYQASKYDKLHLIVICAVLMATPSFNPDLI